MKAIQLTVHACGFATCWQQIRLCFLCTQQLLCLGYGSVADVILFSPHSHSCTLCRHCTQVVREAYPDHTAWDPTSDYFDPKSSEESPKWSMVDFQLVRKLNRPITLEELKQHKDGSLADMALFNRSRLSVQPVSKQSWQFILSLEELQEPTGKENDKGTG